jgi:hypothetical protein
MSVTVREVTAPAEIAKLSGREVVLVRDSAIFTTASLGVFHGILTVEGDTWLLRHVDENGEPKRGRPAKGTNEDINRVLVPAQR